MTATQQLEWIDDRWHLDGRGIHAGQSLEMLWPDGTWEAVCIESEDCGRKLFAYFDYHGRSLCVRVDSEAYYPLPLRWPHHHPRPV